MKLYATRTGTLRNLAEMEAHGWSILLNPFTDLSPTPFRYGFDNGAWRAFIEGVPFDVPLFMSAVQRVGGGADFIVAPDIVAGGLESLAMSLAFLPQLMAINPLVLIPLQDGMTEADILPLLRPGVGLFLGGSTEWKLATMVPWGRFARWHGVYFHVGRVNTAKRIHLAVAAGADSVDGTSGTRFAKTIAPLTRAAGQRDLLTPKAA